MIAVNLGATWKFRMALADQTSFGNGADRFLGILSLLTFHND
jgi:hypothetical protein